MTEAHILCRQMETPLIAKKNKKIQEMKFSEGWRGFDITLAGYKLYNGGNQWLRNRFYKTSILESTK